MLVSLRPNLSVWLRVANTFLLSNMAIFCRFWLFFESLALPKRKAADGVFADAAEIKRTVAFDDVGDLGVAVWGAVLEVADDAALRIEAEDKGVALWAWPEKSRQAHDHLSNERMRQHSVDARLPRRDERKPKFVFAV